MAVPRTIGLAIGPQAWPFILAIALVILVLLFAVAMLVSSRRRAARPEGPEPRAVEIADSRVDSSEQRGEGSEHAASAQTAVPSPAAEGTGVAGEQDAAEPAGMGARRPSDEGEQGRPKVGEERGEPANESPSAKGRPHFADAVPVTPAEDEARPEFPTYTSAGVSLVQRLQQRPAIAVVVALVAGLLLRSIFRRS